MKFLPTFFKNDDWQEPCLYAYFAINYFDEQIFNVIVNRANKFKCKEELRMLLGNGEKSFINLTSSSKDNLSKIRLCQLAFEAALDKDYLDIAFHFI